MEDIVRIKEGMKNKGGVNSPPKTPKAKIKPPPQKPKSVTNRAIQHEKLEYWKLKNEELRQRLKKEASNST